MSYSRSIFTHKTQVINEITNNRLTDVRNDRSFWRDYKIIREIYLYIYI